MKNIKVTLFSNKTFDVENLDEVKILEDENNATIIEVQFPSEYENYSKRVDFLNIRNEKWTMPLYAPEDNRNEYGEDFDKLTFRFTIPSAMAKRGELQIQFVAYLADGTNTVVPFQVLLATINKSIIYATKQGKENPELIIKAYEYSNQALELATEALDKTANSERAALESEASAKAAEQSASEALASAEDAQASATSANVRAGNAEESAKSAQESAEYAESVADSANEKSDNAVSVSNSANEKSDNAVATANNALSVSQNALDVANTANEKSDNAVSTSNSANEKSDQAVETANYAKDTAEEALNQVIEKMGTKVFVGDSEMPEANTHFDSDPQTQITNNKTNIENNANEIENIKTNKTIIANSSGGFSAGKNASATASGAVQLGEGTNSTQDTLQFKDFQVVGANGNIPKERLLDVIYPVGSIYLSVSSTSPQTLFGGTWEQLQDRFLLGAGSYSAGATGGEVNHTLTVAEMPAHNHGVSDPGHTHSFNRGVYRSNAGSGSLANVQKDGGNSSTADPFTSYPSIYSSTTGISINNNGGGAAHNNMPPYLVVYMWKRTA